MKNAEKLVKAKKSKKSEAKRHDETLKRMKKEETRKEVMRGDLRRIVELKRGFFIDLPCAENGPHDFRKTQIFINPGALGQISGLSCKNDTEVTRVDVSFKICYGVDIRISLNSEEVSLATGKQHGCFGY